MIPFSTSIPHLGVVVIFYFCFQPKPHFFQIVEQFEISQCFEKICRRIQSFFLCQNLQKTKQKMKNVICEKKEKSNSFGKSALLDPNFLCKIMFFCLFFPYPGKRNLQNKVFLTTFSAAEMKKTPQTY